MQNNRIELFICDMDGTLLKNDKTISEENRRKIKQIRERGIQFSICTGRIQPMTEYYLKDLSLSAPVITANGALIWDPLDRKVLWEKPVDLEEAMELLRFCQIRRLDYCALTMEGSFFSPGNQRRERFEQYNRIAVGNGYAPMRLEELDPKFDCLKNLSIHKLLILEVEEGQLEEAKGFLKELPDMGWTSSEDRLLDISHSTVSKGKGLLKLCQLMKLAPERVCAMGDYENDLSLFAVAGCSVAMGNGSQKVKQSADFITRTNEEAGVAWAISHFLNET